MRATARARRIPTRARARSPTTRSTAHPVDDGSPAQPRHERRLRRERQRHRAHRRAQPLAHVHLRQARPAERRRPTSRGKTWTSTYFATGELESVTSPLGNKTSYGIDDDGRTISMVEPRGNVGGATPADYTWAYGYDEAGNRTASPTRSGTTIAYELRRARRRHPDHRPARQRDTPRLRRAEPALEGDPARGRRRLERSRPSTPTTRPATSPAAPTRTGTRPAGRTTWTGSIDRTHDAGRNLELRPTTPTATRITLETPAGSSTGTVGDGTISYGYDRMSRPTSSRLLRRDTRRQPQLRPRRPSGDDERRLRHAQLQLRQRRPADRHRPHRRRRRPERHLPTPTTTPATSPAAPTPTRPRAPTFDDDGRLDHDHLRRRDHDVGYDQAGNLTTARCPPATATWSAATTGPAG